MGGTGSVGIVPVAVVPMYGLPFRLVELQNLFTGMYLAPTKEPTAQPTMDAVFRPGLRSWIFGCALGRRDELLLRRRWRNMAAIRKKKGR